jgi:hypothetical protein
MDATIPDTTGNGNRYRIRVVSSNPVIIGSDTTFAINLLPAAPVISANTPVCSGNPLRFITSDHENVTYQWRGPVNYNSNEQNPIIDNINSSQDGQYSLVLYDTLTGCSNTGIIDIEILNSPGLPIISGDTLVCDNDMIFFTTPTQEGMTYHWHGPNGYISNEQNPVINQASTEFSGNYKLSLSDNINGCSSDTAVANIVVVELPEMPTIAFTNPVCYGDIISLTTPYIEQVTYEWTKPDNVTSTEQNLFLENANSDMDGLYSLTIIDKIAGCRSHPGTAFVDVELCYAVNETENSSSLMEVYPNPIKDIVHVKIMKDGILSVFEVGSGKILYQQKHGMSIHTIDVKQWSNGLYQIILQTDKERLGYKFVILK